MPGKRLCYDGLGARSAGEIEDVEIQNYFHYRKFAVMRCPYDSGTCS